MSEYSALFDPLGPRGKFRVRIATIIVSIVMLGLAVLIVFKLAAEGQLAAKKWSPLLNPFDDQFTSVWSFLGGGLVNTGKAAIVAMVASLLIGTGVAVMRISAKSVVRPLIVVGVETLRGIP